MPSRQVVASSLFWGLIAVSLPTRACAEAARPGALRSLIDLDALAQFRPGERAGMFSSTDLSVMGIAGDISYLEGNEQFFVDGEKRASTLGTGTEDYFNGGWYYNQGRFALPLHGLTVKEEKRDSEEKWANSTAPRLLTWGFNSLAGGHGAVEAFEQVRRRECVEVKVLPVAK